MKVHVVEEIGDILEGGDSYHGKQPNTGSRRFVLLKQVSSGKGHVEENLYLMTPVFSIKNVDIGRMTMN
jgi:hypothetical protein